MAVDSDNHELDVEESKIFNTNAASQRSVEAIAPLGSGETAPRSAKAEQVAAMDLLIVPFSNDVAYLVPGFTTVS